MIFTPSIQGMLTDMARNGVFPTVGSGAPTNGTTGKNVAGPGSLYIDYTNKLLYMNTGTLASPTWTAISVGTTNLTLTSPTLVTPVLSGIATGTGTIPNLVQGNASIAQVTAGYAADTYLVGSNISAPPGGFTAKMRYLCSFDMVKTAAGTAAFTITLRIGTTGTTADAAICTFTFGAGTAAVDTGTFDIFATFYSVGSGTAAVVAGIAYCSHALAATGLVSTGASGNGQIENTSSGFNSTTAGLIIGLSVNGGASFSGTNNIVQTELHGF